MIALAGIFFAAVGWWFLAPGFAALLGVDHLEGHDEPIDPAYGLKGK